MKVNVGFRFGFGLDSDWIQAASCSELRRVDNKKGNDGRVYVVWTGVVSGELSRVRPSQRPVCDGMVCGVWGTAV